MNESYADLWQAVAGVRGAADAVVQGARRLSWAGLAERSARLAAALEALGVGPERSVGLCLGNGPEYLEATWAAFGLGATPVNCNYRYGAEELAYVLDDAGAGVLLFDPPATGPALSAAARLPGLRALVEVRGSTCRRDGGPGEPVPPDSLRQNGVLSYEALLAAHDPRPPRARSGDDVYMIYTGGSTGRPKGVRWRHRDLFAWLSWLSYGASGRSLPADAAGAAREAAAAAADGDSPVTLPACPLVHGTAFFFALGTLALGGSVVLAEGRSFDAAAVWEAVEAESVTQLVIVGDAQARPAGAALDEAAAAGRPYRTASLRRVFSSGLLWTAEAKAGLARHCRATMIDMLGSSEGGPFGIDVVGPGQVPTTGRFAITERAAVLRADGSPVGRGTGEVGRLAITDPIPLGYHNDPGRTVATFPTYSGRRWSVPGDQASLEADGTIRLLGRGSTCVNSGGEKVYPEEVEEAVKAHPDVADCLVVGVPDRDWGEVVAAVVSPRAGSEVGAGELDRWVRGRLAGFKVPRRWYLVGAVVRSPAGKADYRWAGQVASSGAGEGAPEPGSGGAPQAVAGRGATRDSRGRRAASTPPDQA